MKNNKNTIITGLLAYILWGLLPIFWKQISDISALEVLAHRIIWSVVFLSPCVYLLDRKNIFSLRALLSSLPSAIALSVNWGVYIWAVSNGYIIASSLGYFISPLLYIFAGYLLLGEKLSKITKIRLLLGALAILPLISTSGIATAIISSFLGLSIVTYGYLRKKSNASSLQGLFYESVNLAPIAVIFLMLKHQSIEPRYFLFLDYSTYKSILLVASGLATSIPLLLFVYTIQRIPFNKISEFQYISPTLQFLIAILVYQEPIDTYKLISFSLVWLGILLLYFERKS